MIMMCLIGGVSTIFAEESTDAEQLPDLEMLEYLGSWETENGDWFDPLQLFELAENSLNTVDERRRTDD